MKSFVVLACVFVISMVSVGEAGVFRSNHRHNHHNHRHNHNFNFGHHRNFGYNFGYGFSGLGYGGFSGGSTVIVQQPDTQAPVIAAPPDAPAAPVAPQPAPATDVGIAQAIKDLSKIGPVEIVIMPDGKTVVRLLGGTPKPDNPKPDEKP